jgi:hypothetical protein
MHRLASLDRQYHRRDGTAYRFGRACVHASPSKRNEWRTVTDNAGRDYVSHIAERHAIDGRHRHNPMRAHAHNQYAHATATYFCQ